MFLSRLRKWSGSRRLAFAAGLTFLSFLLVVGALRWRIRAESAARYNAVAARLDRDDPGWTWEEMQSARTAIPDERNAFTPIAAVIALHGRNLTVADEPNLSQWRRYPEKIPFEVADWMGGHLAAREKAVLTARNLIDFPSGRHPIKYTEDFVSTLLPTAQETRGIANLLQWDCRMQSGLGRFDLAVMDIRAMRNAARSFGDEGFVILVLIRLAIDNLAVQSLQEMLSMGEPPPEALAALQRDFEEEARDHPLREGLRSERASSLKSLQFFGRNLDIKTLRTMYGLVGPSPHPRGISEWTAPFRYPSYAQFDQAVFLEEMTRLIAIVDGPTEGILPGIKAWEAEWKRTWLPDGEPSIRVLLSAAFVPAVPKVAGAQLRTWALLRCSAAGIAAERFRRAEGRWPAKLDELVPKYIAAVPDDPYTGTPLLFKKLLDGIAIYSLGDDLVDDGGAVLNEKESPGRERGDYEFSPPKDFGIRVWDAERRGKTPLR